MKTIFTIFTYFLTWNVIMGQEIPLPPPPPQIEDDTCFDKIHLRYKETWARFPGCEDEVLEKRMDCANKKMLDFIYSKLRYPKETCVEGTVVISFIIKEDGSLSNFKIVRNLGGGTSEEALRVVQMLPNFIPATRCEKAIKSIFYLPIKFRLQ